MREKGRTIGARLGRVLVLGLAVFLVLGQASIASPEEQASATDMRLESIEGTVTVCNGSGRALSLREGMKLYSGYTLSTDAESYAYVTLDETKVVKLDAGSQAELRKDGTQLELLVVSGSLFFNVKSPLEQEETLNIRTSTMVTGIRGTSGYVCAGVEAYDSVTILDGAVTVASAAGEGDFQTVTVQSGQTGYGVPQGDEAVQVTIQDLTGEEIPGFVAVEIARDPDLAQRIREDTDLPVDEIIAGAQERLRADQQAQAAAAQQAEPVENRVIRSDLFPTQDQTGTGDAGGTGAQPGGDSPEPQKPAPDQPSGSGTDSTPEPDPEPNPDPQPTPDPEPEPDPDPEPTPEPDPEPEPEPEPEDYVVTGAVTGTQLLEYLNDYQTVTISEGASVTVAQGETVTVAAGKTLILAAGSTLTNAGEVVIQGTLTCEGTYLGRLPTGDGVMEGLPTAPAGVGIDADGAYHILSDMAGDTLADWLTWPESAQIVVEVDSGAEVTIQSGTTVVVAEGQSLTIGEGASLTVEAGGALENAGRLTNHGALVNDGFLSNSASGLYRGNAPTGSGTVMGIILLPEGMDVDDGGVYHVVEDLEGNVLSTWLSGSGVTAGQIVVDAGVTVTIASDETLSLSSGFTLTVAQNGEIVVEGQLTNYAVLENEGRITVGDSGYLYNYSGVTNQGTLVNRGTVTSLYSSYGQMTAKVDNYGTITNQGSFWNAQSTSSNQVRLNNYGTFSNETGGSLMNYHTMVNEASGQLVNEGSINNHGTLTNQGSYSGGGTVQNSGTLDGDTPIPATN